VQLYKYYKIKYNYLIIACKQYKILCEFAEGGSSTSVVGYTRVSVWILVSAWLEW